MRRSLVCAAAAAVLLLSVGSAEAAAPRVAMFGMRVPHSATARAASGAILTRALTAPQRFDMVGADWSGGPAKVWLRGRREGGRWSRWVQLDAAEEPLAHGAGTEPIWAGGFRVVQLRAEHPLPGLRLSFVRVQRQASASRAPRTIPVQLPPPAGGTMQVVPRAAWGASRCKPRATAGYGQVDFAIVHHTDSLNGYTRSDSPAMVLGICLFHRNVNHWNDIGYNLLVDKYGQVFEGRAGGLDAQVIGAQAGGFNAWSTGVATLGSFGSTRFSGAGINALAHVLAWKLSLNGVPAVGTTSVISDGGPFTPFRAGAHVTVNRISGHRDVDSTACPGNALYAQLPALRRLVASMEGPVSQLSLATRAATLTYPQPLVLSGTLAESPGLSTPPGATVEIQDSLAAGGRTLAAVPLADGVFGASLPIAHNDVVRAVFVGGGALPRVVSTPIVVTVVPVLTMRASAPAVPAASAVTLTGTVAPAKRRLLVVEQRLRRGKYQRVRQIRVGARAGAFSLNVRLPKAGAYRFIARSPADRLTAAGASLPVQVAVG